MSLILGIDPGVTGALVLLDDGRPVEWEAMPLLKASTAKRVNAAAMAALVRGWAPERAAVELVASRPGQGVASMFSFGHSAGVVLGVLGALEIPVVEITPRQWKARAHLTGTEKDASRAMAIARWPSWRALDAKLHGQALADAALIAVYGIPKGSL